MSDYDTAALIAAVALLVTTLLVTLKLADHLERWHRERVLRRHYLDDVAAGRRTGGEWR